MANVSLATLIQTENLRWYPQTAQELAKVMFEKNVWLYSQLSLNAHLYKTDAPLRQTTGIFETVNGQMSGGGGSVLCSRAKYLQKEV